jgi:hypothetical protein
MYGNAQELTATRKGPSITPFWPFATLYSSAAAGSST